MNTENLRLSALIRQAEAVPDEQLASLGMLANLGLWLRGNDRCRFFNGLDRIFGYGPEQHKDGFFSLLSMSSLDGDIIADAIQEVDRLRKAIKLEDMECIRKFFSALRSTRVLREYHRLTLNPFTKEGEDEMWTIFDGTAFRDGGLVSKLLMPCKVHAAIDAAPKGQPGRKTSTEDIASLVNDLRKNGATWKEVLKMCRAEFAPGRITGVDQLRSIWSRHFGSKK